MPERTEAEPTAKPAPPSNDTKRNVLLIGGVVIAFLLLFYFKGSFDRPLSSIGLNFHECARNGLGATFCGSELDQYRERVERIKTQSKEAGERAKASFEETERKGHEERATRERSEASEASERRLAHGRELASKMRHEKAIIESEPEGSVSRDLAETEYNAAKAELQQLATEARVAEGK
jgi:hypothetical protein